MELKDYLHLYLGCEVQVRKKDRNKEWLTGRISEVTRNSNHGDWIEVWFDEVYKITNAEWQEISSNAHTYFIGYDEIKPILRPLEDMTDAEEKEMVATQDKIEFKGYNLLVDSGETFKYMLSKHFDLFGLIEAGLAIDKTSLQQQLNKD